MAIQNHIRLGRGSRQLCCRAINTTNVATGISRGTAATSVVRRCYLGNVEKSRRCDTCRANFSPKRPRTFGSRSKVVAQVGFQELSLSQAVLFNSAVFTLGYKVLSSGLSNLAILHSWILGTTCLAAFQVEGYAMVCAYFVVGTLVTKIGKKIKVSEGTYERNQGKRTPASVWGSGIAGAVCALLSLTLSGNERFASMNMDMLLRTGFVASFASKISDTAASEIGKAYGKTTFLITNLKRVKRGTDGAISLEGTLAGIFVSAAYTGLAFGLGLVNGKGAFACVLASFMANNIESVLGATVQQTHSSVLTNDVVNMAQISIAALLAILVQGVAVSAM